MYSNKNMASNSRYNNLRKPSNSNKITSINENEKPSQIVANNIVYSSPKYISNYNSNVVPKEEVPFNMTRMTEKEENRVIKENKELREEIYNLKKKNLDKEKQLKEKDLMIKELEDKIKKLELENSRTRDKLNKLESRSSRRSSENPNKTKKEEEELALALEQINEMERRNSRINSNNNIFNNRPLRNDPFEFNIDPTDIININSISDHPLFANFFHRFEPNIGIDNDILHNNSAYPNDEIERHIIDQLCPNPDDMTYEQLLELQENVGHVERGFRKSEIEKIPTIKFNKVLYRNLDKCTVCQYDYNNNEILRKLTCGHIYHRQCIDEWLTKDKKCPVCKMEVSLK